MPQTDTPKPTKPYPDFPLFPHATKRWAKKIRGKTHYFGHWDDPDGAVRKYLDQKDDLQAGRTPRPRTEDSFTIEDLCNRFLDSKAALLDAGELSPRTLEEYHRICRDLAAHLGKRRAIVDLHPDDFEELRAKLAKRLGPTQLGNSIQRIRSVFKFAFDAMLIEKPVRFGPVFKRPSRKTLRHVRNQRGLRMFEAPEILTMLENASGQLKAIILLGANCGFGQTDCATLPRSAVDLESGWLEFPRPKTGIQRRIPLWPETVTALREVTEKRRRPAKSPEDDSLVFLTQQGHAWTRTKRRPNPQPGQAEFVPIDSIGLQFSKLLRKLELKRAGLSFYGLRHGFETVAGESRDQVAVDAIMGHVDASMAGHYRERISDERLQAVVDHVRGWLWPDMETQTNSDPG